MKIELGSEHRVVMEDGRIALQRRVSQPPVSPGVLINLGRDHRIAIADSRIALQRRVYPESGEIGNTERRIENLVGETVKKVFAPKWTWGLIGANAAAFALGQAIPELKELASSSPVGFAFHQDWSHFLGNMIPLLILGANAEKSSGGAKMALSYLLGGYAGSLANMAIPVKSPEFEITLPRESIGASGAVMGLLSLGMVNAFKEKTYGKLAALTTGATLILGLNSSPQIDTLGHLVGFATGLVSGIFTGKKETPEHNIVQQRQTQRAGLTPAGV